MNGSIPPPKAPGGFRRTSPVAQYAELNSQADEGREAGANEDESKVPAAAAGGKVGQAKADKPEATAATVEEKADPAKADKPKSPAAGGGARKAVGGRGDRAASSPSAAGGRKVFMLHIDEGLKQRMLNTVVWTGGSTGLRNQQAFVRRAIADLCDKLEREQNDGAPFAAVEDATGT